MRTSTAVSPPRPGRRQSCSNFDQLSALVDSRTKLVCCTGASNFLGTKPPIRTIRQIADHSCYSQPDGESRSLLLVDGTQMVPSTYVDVVDLDVDYLAFSFHKILAPFGVGGLYAKEHLLQRALPFLYGGDMIAEGRVAPERVEYNDLPWKYSAGTPNILGVIVSAQALRLVVDLVSPPGEQGYFRTSAPMPRASVERTMGLISDHTRMLTQHAIETLRGIDGLTVYGPADARERSPLVAFNVAGRNPVELAEGLNLEGVESRAGCHCATIAHRDLGLDPPASARLSFYLYNTIDDVELAAAALGQLVSADMVRR